ncbi:nucleoporin Nup37-like [Haliotis cracherodii]|uniref:nucleoporin Nup37-like n=1 Tax=Haliotis cracherodii TaxID=6455 RepID=UPI0039EA4898
MEDGRSTAYSIPCHDVVQCVEFSPFEWSSQLLAVATSTRISIFTCRFQEEDATVDGVQYSQIHDFQSSTNTTALAWSPSTSLSVLPKNISFVCAGEDYKLNLFHSDGKDNTTEQTYCGHNDFVNAVTFDPGDGSKFASTGDDLTCRIWSTEGQQLLVFQLTSPGMSVCWHSEEPLKILVGQKNGVIRIFSLTNQQPIMSLSCGQVPSLAADWSRHSSLQVGAIAGTDWLIFDTSVSSQPIEKRQAHIEGTKYFKFARCHQSLLATIGRPGRQVKVFNTRHQQLHVNASLQVAYGLTWHHTLPIIAVGGDKKVHLWVVESA